MTRAAGHVWLSRLRCLCIAAPLIVMACGCSAGRKADIAESGGATSLLELLQRNPQSPPIPAESYFASAPDDAPTSHRDRVSERRSRNLSSSAVQASAAEREQIPARRSASLPARHPRDPATHRQARDVLLTGAEEESRTDGPSLIAPSLPIPATLGDPKPGLPVSVGQDELSPPPPPRPAQELKAPGSDLAPARPDDATISDPDSVTLVVREESLGAVLSMIAEQHGLNIVTGDEVSGAVSLTLKNVPLDDALDAILTANGYTWSRHKNILMVSHVANDTRLSPSAQGRVLRVIQLNFASASDIDRVVKGLLSPVGQSVVTETSVEHVRRTREEIVIEDLPEYVARIESYILQADVPPRQVYVEAHVLQVTLKDDTLHGVNLREVLRLARARITLETVGFANPKANPAFFLGIDGTDIDGLVQCLKTTTDAKTLASPELLVLNGQEARIQVGQSLGYFITTTTQTSTLQNVDFLNVGVVLNVTPQICEDGRIMLRVKPEVSDGRINPASGLPDKTTTEVETTVMLNDGQGMVIGGLIKEEVTEVQNKVPIAGDLWLVGRAFQRRSMLKQRNEYIIALVPRIIPCGMPETIEDYRKLERAQTPLVEGALHRVERRAWEPQLPDAMRDPRRPEWDRLWHAPQDLHNEYPNPKSYYYPSVNEQREGRYAE